MHGETFTRAYLKGLPEGAIEMANALANSKRMSLLNALSASAGEFP